MRITSTKNPDSPADYQVLDHIYKETYCSKCNHKGLQHVGYSDNRFIEKGENGVDTVGMLWWVTLCPTCDVQTWVPIKGPTPVQSLATRAKEVEE